MSRRMLILGVPVLTGLIVSTALWPSAAQVPTVKRRKVEKTDAEWAKQLTRSQYLVTRQKATEPAFSGKYAMSHTKGTYECVCCGAELFSSAAKFESGTGWPSFFQPIDPKKIDTEIDTHLAETRTEVMCKDCGAHLAHVFDDGPAPTGLRFCINSAALKLIPASGAAAAKKIAKSKTGKAKAKNAEPAEEKDKAKEKTAEPAKTEEPKGDPKSSGF